MPYRLTLTDANNNNTIYTFQVERLGRGGWAELRLVRIEDYDANGTQTRITEYDPLIHDGGSHYMSYLWRARGIKVGNKIDYYLVGAFGEPGSRFDLTYVD